MEIWKQIDNNYYISNLGNVKSVKREGTKGGLLKPSIKKTGYLSVKLNKDKLIHRLVAEHFIPNPHNKPCVDHIDFNKSNNNVTNLRWVTYEENNKYRYDAGRANQYTIQKIKLEDSANSIS